MASKIKKVIIFFVFSFNLFSNENLFKSGVELYKNGNFEGAIREWQKLEKDHNDWRIFYNIGNAYAKLGKIGFAMLYYEKALKIKFDERIAKNIEFLKLKLKDKIEQQQKTPLRKTLEKIYRKLNFNNLIYPFIISFFLLNLIISFYLIFPEKFPKYLIIIFSFLIAFFLITGALLFHFWYMEKNIHYGIIIEDTIDVKSAPMEDATDLFVIHEGLKVRVYEEIENWVRIVLPNGMSGFVKKESLNII